MLGKLARARGGMRPLRGITVIPTCGAAPAPVMPRVSPGYWIPYLDLVERAAIRPKRPVMPRRGCAPPRPARPGTPHRAKSVNPREEMAVSVSHPAGCSFADATTRLKMIPGDLMKRPLECHAECPLQYRAWTCRVVAFVNLPKNGTGASSLPP